MRFALVCIVIVSTSVLFAQNGAHTAARLNAISSIVIPKGDFEFEPNYSASFQKKAWDQEGELQNSFANDSIGVSTSLSFRVNYSPLKGMEIASVIPSDASSIYAGVKYIFLDSVAIKLNGFYGVNLPLDNRVIGTQSVEVDNRVAHGLGIGATCEASDRLGIDLSAEYQVSNFGENDRLSDIFVYADIGYYLWSEVMVFNSFGYQKIHPELIDSYVFSLYPGFAIERGERFVIAVNGQFDVLGQNAEKTSGINMALTMVFD